MNNQKNSILIIGGGGREYSIGLALYRENNNKIYFAPGNGATENLGENIDIKDFNQLVNFAREKNIDLTIVGPEQPLVDGIVDIFKENNLTIFGPSKKASQLEGSKVYMKNFLKKYNIPTAKYIETNNKNDAFKFIDEELDTLPIVVKADGLCAGKGVIIAQSKEEAKNTIINMLTGESFGEAGKKVIVEEFLNGYELSLFAICDGKNFKILPAAQDHKRLLDNDKGPNTGGMGAYSPTPLIDEKLYQKISDKIIQPTLDGMAKDGNPYEGVLFCGIMVVNNEPITLEFNVRFGDPECEIIMPLLKSSAFELFYKGSTKDLDTLNIEFLNKIGVGVVIASENYPYKSSEPAEIIIKEETKNCHIAYAGVSKKDNKLFATGGRVLLSIGLGDTIKEARDLAYKQIKNINFSGMKYRTDIAYQALK